MRATDDLTTRTEQEAWRAFMQLPGADPRAIQVQRQEGDKICFVQITTVPPPKDCVSYMFRDIK